MNNPQLRTVIFFRHAQTDKAKPDSARRLTAEGKAQAARRRELLGKPIFEIGFHSPMERTRETLEILAGGPIPTRMIPELLHDSSTKDGKLLDAASDQLGYATVDTYLRHPPAELRPALRRFGTTAWSAFMEAIESTSPTAFIIVVGHAVLVPLMIYMSCQGLDIMERVAGINLGECEGIRVSIDKDGNIYDMEPICG